MSTVLQQRDALKVFWQSVACRARSASDDVQLYSLVFSLHLSGAESSTNLCLSVTAIHIAHVACQLSNALVDMGGGVFT